MLLLCLHVSVISLPWIGYILADYNFSVAGEDEYGVFMGVHSMQLCIKFCILCQVVPESKVNVGFIVQVFLCIKLKESKLCFSLSCA